MKVIVYVENGNVCVMSIAPGLDISIEEIADRDVPDGCEFIIVDSGSLPEGGVQETWSIVDGSVVVDDEKMNSYLASQATMKKTELINFFWSSTANWRLDAQMGDISNEDSKSLKEWISWRKKVEAIDPESASKENPLIFPDHP